MRDALPMTPQRFNILLVDDSEADAKLFELALREVAPRVTLYWVATGDEALEAVQRGDRFKDVLGVDIIVMDLNMPKMGGFQVLEKLKESNTLIPVIVLSSSRSVNDVERAYQMGANSYLVKPMTIEGLHDLVRGISRYWLELAKLPAL